MSRHKDRDLWSGDDNKKRVGLATRNSGSSGSNFEVDSSQVYRQEKFYLAHRKIRQKDQTRARSEEHSSCTRKRDASSPMRFTDHQYMGKTFQCTQKEFARSAINATFSMESYHANVLTWRMFMASSMKAAIHLGPDFQKNLVIYKNTRFENIKNVFFINEKKKEQKNILKKF